MVARNGLDWLVAQRRLCRFGATRKGVSSGDEKRTEEEDARGHGQTLTERSIAERFADVTDEEQLWGDISAETRALAKRLLKHSLAEELTARLHAAPYRRTEVHRGWRIGSYPRRLFRPLRRLGHPDAAAAAAGVSRWPQARRRCTDAPGGRARVPGVGGAVAGGAPATGRCVEQDLAALLACSACPQGHWRTLRATNAIERAFREVRRRTRPMSCFQNNARCERIIAAVVSRLNERWSRAHAPVPTQAS